MFRKFRKRAATTSHTDAEGLPAQGATIGDGGVLDSAAALLERCPFPFEAPVLPRTAAKAPRTAAKARAAAAAAVSAESEVRCGPCDRSGMKPPARTCMLGRGTHLEAAVFVGPMRFAAAFWLARAA